MFSPNGVANITNGKYTCNETPMNLSESIRNKLKVGKKYHSGSISIGVANGFACSLTFKGSCRASPNIVDVIPNITTGKMYNISFGHAGSP